MSEISVLTHATILNDRVRSKTVRNKAVKTYLFSRTPPLKYWPIREMLTTWRCPRRRIQTGIVFSMRGAASYVHLNKTRSGAASPDSSFSHMSSLMLSIQLSSSQLFLSFFSTGHLFTYLLLFIKTYLYRVVHNQIIIIMFYSVAMLLAKSKSSDNLKNQTLFTS